MSLNYANATIVNAAPVNNAETIVWQSSPATPRYDGDQWCIEGVVDFTTGATTTAVTLRLRRGSLVTSPVVGAAELDTVGAAVSQPVPFQFVDSPGAVAGQVYSLTYQATGATGNATIVSVAGEVSIGQP
jgi:hypothetical protein